PKLLARYIFLPSDNSSLGSEPSRPSLAPGAPIGDASLAEASAVAASPDCAGSAELADWLARSPVVLQAASAMAPAARSNARAIPLRMHNNLAGNARTPGTLRG